MNGIRISGLSPVPRIARWSILMLSVAVLLPVTASGSAFYLTGTLTTPESVFETTFALPASSTVTFQTWGFGGGTNAGGQVIPAGGFDPLIALFSGPVATASMYVDGSGNPLADSDNLQNPPWSFVGNCPPAVTVAIGSDSDCGDDFIQVVLAAGTYTLSLTDANYIPNAIYDNGVLSEGFTDFTAGVFQTCDPVSNSCIATNGNYAVDITSNSGFAPEPGALPLVAAGFAALAGLKRSRNRINGEHL
jgi:hypothetical protein